MEIYSQGVLSLLVEQQHLQKTQAHMQRLAITDPLTGLFNTLFQRLIADVAPAHTIQSPLAVILYNLALVRLYHTGASPIQIPLTFCCTKPMSGSTKPNKPVEIVLLPHTQSIQ